MEGFRSLPTLGVGISFREELSGLIAECEASLDFFELIAEKLLVFPGYFDLHRKILGKKRLVFHGVEMSIGSADEYDTDNLPKVKALVDKYRPFWYGEHVAFTRSQGFDIAQLMPVKRDNLMLALMRDKAQRIKASLPVPLLLENISYYFDYPEQRYPDAEFFNRLVEGVDCAILCDANNLVLNAKNHGFNEFDWLAAIDLRRIVEIHVSGGEQATGFLYDTHGGEISDRTLEVADYILSKAPHVKGIVIERDRNFTDLTLLRNHIGVLGQMFSDYRRAQPISVGK